MTYFKEPKFKREIAVFIALAVAFILAGLLVSPVCAAVLFVSGACFTGVHLFMSLERYRSISRLSRDIDRILHGQESVLVAENYEGELSILSSEVQKMTLRLREQADRLRADKLRLTGAIEDIFHQLRTPLTSMTLTVTLLEDDTLTPERRLRLTRELKRHLEKMQWLVETLLKMSKIDAGTAQFRSERVSVADVIRRAAEPFLIPMELRGQTLTVEVGDTGFTGDLEWSSEAAGNLLKNAMEHTPEGGEIRVTAEETPLFTQIIFKDSGEGFDRDDIPNLFHRFYRGKNAAPGSIGIGLAFARMIIASQNGTVTAENARDGGAMFTVRFYKAVV